MPRGLSYCGRPTQGGATDPSLFGVELEFTEEHRRDADTLERAAVAYTVIDSMEELPSLSDMRDRCVVQFERRECARALIVSVRW